VTTKPEVVELRRILESATPKTEEKQHHGITLHFHGPVILGAGLTIQELLAKLL
jgi:hypothetical protein